MSSIRSPRRKGRPDLPSPRVTTMPPTGRPRWTPAAIANLVGVLLTLGGVVAVPWALWHISPWLGASILAAYTAAAGYLLATTEFGQEG